MAIRFDRLKNLSSVLASLSLVALTANGCGSSDEQERAVPLPLDAGHVRPDAQSADAGNQTGDDGAAPDAASDRTENDDASDGGSPFDASDCSCVVGDTG